MNYFEVSAKSGSGVVETFEYMSARILSATKAMPDFLKHSKDSFIVSASSNKKGNEKKKKCC